MAKMALVSNRVGQYNPIVIPINQFRLSLLLFQIYLYNMWCYHTYIMHKNVKLFVYGSAKNDFLRQIYNKFMIKTKRKKKLKDYSALLNAKVSQKFPTTLKIVHTMVILRCFDDFPYFPILWLSTYQSIWRK